MRKENTINYRGDWDSNGTYYDQHVNISSACWDKLMNILQAELAKPDIDCYDKLYLSTSMEYRDETEGRIYWTNLTQARLFSRFLKLDRFKYDRNTAFLVF